MAYSSLATSTFTALGACGNCPGGLSSAQMTYLDDIIHFCSNYRAENAKVLFILPPRITFGKSAIKVLSENNFLVYGVLWNIINIFIIYVPEMIIIVFV